MMSACRDSQGHFQASLGGAAGFMRQGREVEDSHFSATQFGRGADNRPRRSFIETLIFLS
jgi:hypothetical protein